MPRIRTLKPELASDRKLASVSRDARYTFVLLISQADDDGLLRAEPRQLLGGLYPFDHDVSGPNLEQWLEELRAKGQIRWRRTLDGVRVIEIVNWSKHQKIKNRSNPFLLNHLAELGESETGFSVEPTEEGVNPSVEAGGAESRVLSLESRVLSGGGASPESLPPTNGKHPKAGRAPPLDPNEEAVIAHYRSRHPKRMRGEVPRKTATLLRNALKNYSVDELRLAIDHNAASKFHREGNHMNLDLILRDASHIDYYLGLTEVTAGDTTGLKDEPALEYLDG